MQIVEKGKWFSKERKNRTICALKKQNSMRFLQQKIYTLHPKTYTLNRITELLEMILNSV